MYDYIEPYITADLILETLNTSFIRMHESDIAQALKDKTQANQIRAALAQLCEDKYIQPDPPDTRWFIQLGSGAQFYKNGGYDQYFKEKRITESLRKELETANLNMANSVTLTNKAMVKNIKRNNTILGLTLVVAAVSAFGTIGGYIISRNKKNTKDTIVVSLPPSQNLSQPPNNNRQQPIATVPAPPKAANDSANKIKDTSKYNKPH